MRDTQSSCEGPLTWKAQIHDVGHRVTSDRNLPSSCFVVQYNSSMSILKLRFTIIMFTININCICCEKGKDRTVFVTENF